MNYLHYSYSPSRKTPRPALRVSVLGFGLFWGALVIVILSQLGF